MDHHDGSAVINVLRRIWSEAFGLPDLDVDADFFELGGDSLLAMTIARKASEEGLDVSVRRILEFSTVRTIAASLERSHSE